MKVQSWSSSGCTNEVWAVWLTQAGHAIMRIKWIIPSRTLTCKFWWFTVIAVNILKHVYIESWHKILIVQWTQISISCDEGGCIASSCYVIFYYENILFWSERDCLSVRNKVLALKVHFTLHVEWIIKENKKVCVPVCECLHVHGNRKIGELFISNQLVLGYLTRIKI